MEKDTLNKILLAIMDVYNEDMDNDKKHGVLSKLWTDYYKLSEKYNIKIDYAYQLYLIGESESYIIKEEPKRFVIDESRLDEAIDSFQKGNDLTDEEIEILLQASVMNARHGFETLGIDIKNNSLNGFCELGQALSLMPLENIGVKVIKNSASKSFDYPFNHVFGIAIFPHNGGIKPCLIDTTCRQLFATNRCNEGRYYQEEENTGLKVAPDPGYFVEDEEFARSLMRNGYIELTEETATKYGEAFHKASIPLKDIDKINDSNINYYQRMLNDREDYKISDGELEGLNVVFNDKTNINKI